MFFCNLRHLESDGDFFIEKKRMILYNISIELLKIYKFLFGDFNQPEEDLQHENCYKENVL